jgi:integrase
MLSSLTISSRSKPGWPSEAREHPALVALLMKCLLGYARDVLQIPVLDMTAIKVPRPPRRQVSYLSPEELEKFLSAIPLRTWTGKARLSGYCFRALVETLAATGMRISESLSLNRDSLNQERKEAVIVGKGNKQRTVFFTDRALQWITLESCTFCHPEEQAPYR